MGNEPRTPLARALFATRPTPEQWALIDRLNWGIPLTEPPQSDEQAHDEASPPAARALGR